jgi:hypothetical protein
MALPGASGSLALERMQKKIAAAAIGGILSSMGKQNGNPGLYVLALVNRSVKSKSRLRNLCNGEK